MFNIFRKLRNTPIDALDAPVLLPFHFPVIIEIEGKIKDKQFDKDFRETLTKFSEKYQIGIIRHNCGVLYFRMYWYFVVGFLAGLAIGLFIWELINENA